jgi:hypothetical protein
MNKFSDYVRIKEEVQDDFEFEFDGPNAIDDYGNKLSIVYRGMAGQYIPPSSEAKEELAKWNSFLDYHFKDSHQEVQYLKKIGKYGRVLALQRVENDQSVTTNLQQAIDYAKRVSMRTGIQPPIIVKVEMPSMELARFSFKSGDQRNRDVYDVPADVFAQYYEENGQTLSIPQAISAVGSKAKLSGVR